jgi:hypothetical protein
MTRGVNVRSPNLVWFLVPVLGVFSPDGPEAMGNPLPTPLRSTKGMFVIRCRRRLNGV